MKYLSFILIAFALSSCCASQNQVIRYLQAKGNQEIVTEYDTLYTANIRIDTLIRLDTLVDSIIVTREKLMVEIKRVSDTRYIQVRAECKPDTVIVEKQVTRIEFKPKAEAKGFWYHAQLVSLGVVGLCIFGLLVFLAIRVARLFI